MARQDMEPISIGCYDILDFQQDIAWKTPKVTIVPLLLRSDNIAMEWFWGWVSHNIAPFSPNPPAVPQYHSGLTGVFSYIAT